jgi:CubicO group peptidase (beta-lactamase class C family)
MEVNAAVLFFSLLLFLVIFLPIVLCRLFDLPSPWTILKLALKFVPPSKVYACFDAKIVCKPLVSTSLGARPCKLEIRTMWHGATLVSLEEFLSKTHTKAFLVINDNAIVYEAYYGGADKATIFPANSVTKVFLSTLVGIAVDSGKLHLEDRVGQYLDRSSIGEGCSEITIYELLNGRSRLDVPEKYSGLWGAIVKMYLTTDLNRFMRSVGRFDSKRDKFEYRSVDAQLLGQVLSRVLGAPLSELLEIYLWRPLGAEQNCSWNIDSKKFGVEKAFSGLNATARDFAKLGSLYLNEGTSNGVRVLSSDWARMPSSPTEYDDGRRMGYRNNWWAPFMNTRDGSYSSIGIHGQYIYVNPKHKTVIVKLSEHGMEEDLEFTFSAFQQIARVAQSLNPGAAVHAMPQELEPVLVS